MANEWMKSAVLTSLLSAFIAASNMYRLVQKKGDSFDNHQPGVAGCGWLQPG